MNELEQSTIRLQNAQAKMLELDIAEREKALRSSEDCWMHILRFGQAMRDLPIPSRTSRDLLLVGIESQMKISKELLFGEQTQ